ncbi:MAG: polysaccharide deacetylase family protein [Planctomycetota bacterium]|jgi:peptidoglycan/xylan/chitin deacetylase (PgdA/CDA1 family)
MDGRDPSASIVRESGPTVHSERFQKTDDDAPRCLVVMYHYVHDTEPVTSGEVGGLTSSEFNAQLDQLTRTMTPTDWPSLYAWMQGRGSIPRRCFLLTFDDGLADHAEVVLPILQDRGIRGAFFVPGCVLTSHRLLPAHAIHLLLATLGEKRLTEELVKRLSEIAGDTDWLGTLNTAAAEGMYHYESSERAHLKYLLTMVLPISLRETTVEALFEQHVGSPVRWSRHWYLGWDDLAKMQSLGHTIGGHGFSHEPYTRLSPTERGEDMRRVAGVLRDGLGADIRPFSYPYGSFDDAICTSCQGSGFAHAFSTEQRLVVRHSDLMRLPRVDTIHVDAVLREELVCART